MRGFLTRHDDARRGDDPAGHAAGHRPLPRSVTVAYLLVAAVAAVAGFVPVPFLSYAPGPVYDTLGSVDGTRIVAISGRTTYDSDGHLDMTTVREFGGADRGVYLLEAIRGWLDPAIRVVPRESVYPDDSVTEEEVDQVNSEAFRISQADAVSAAMRHLRIPVQTRVLVTAVVAGSPSDGVIRAGSRVVSVDGVAIDSPRQVVDVVRGSAIGTAHEFVLEREGRRETRKVTSVANPRDAAVPFVGISLGMDYRAPFPITFALDNVGGPSAGTMFALSIVEQLTPGDMTGGRHVAGTGEISADGKVGPIGGIAQKMVGARRAGAELFLVPAGNCSDIAGVVPEGLVTARVATLDEAVDAVTRFGRGDRDLPRC